MTILKEQLAVYVLAFILAVLSITNIVSVRRASENQLDRARFAPYMRCLIVPDEVLYEELGRDGYVRYCEEELDK